MLGGVGTKEGPRKEHEKRDSTLKARSQLLRIRMNEGLS